MTGATLDEPGGANPAVPRGVALYCVVTGLLAASTLMIATPVLLDLPAGEPLFVLPLLLMAGKLVIIYGLLKLRAWGWVLEVLWLGGYAATSLADGQLPVAAGTLGLLCYFLMQYSVYLDRLDGPA